MNFPMRLMRKRIIFLAAILCFLQKSASFEVSPNRSGSETSASKDIWRLTTKEEESTTSGKAQTNGEFAGKTVSSFLVKDVDRKTKRKTDRLSDEFDPFMDFPLFPFRSAGPKRNASFPSFSKRGINPQEDERGWKRIRSPRKPKPFLFIDFAFRVEEIPVKNGTMELQSSVEDSPRHTNKPKISYDGREGRKRKEDVPLDLLRDDWSFFDDLPFLSPGTNDFLPKSKLLSLELPFHGMQTVKQSRRNRDKFLVSPKSDTNILQGIFDEAMSSMKREMERTLPLWNFLVRSEKVIRSAEHEEGLTSLVSDVPENKLNQSMLFNAMTPIRNEMVFRQNPVATGNVEKIEEIWVRDDRSRIKKKRRNSRGLAKREKQGIGESSIKARHAGEGIKEKFSSFGYLPTHLSDIFRKLREEKKESGRTTPGFQNVKILDLVSQWSRREMGDAPFGTGAGEKAEKSGSSGYSPLKSKRHNKNPGQIRGNIKASGRGGLFEILKPQQSSSWRTRQDNDGGGTWENVTASRDEFKKNITHALEQFFAIMKDLQESNSHDVKDKDNHEINDDITWPEMGQMRAPSSYAQPADKGIREGRQASVEDEPPTAPVADLTFLLLTVTLPTTLAFTLLLVICLVNLRAKSWLCKKVFQPRNLYLVEDDLEKSEHLEDKTKVVDDSQNGGEPNKNEKVKETRDERRH